MDYVAIIVQTTAAIVGILIMGLQDFKNIFLREYVYNQRRNKLFEQKFVKNYTGTNFLVEPPDPDPVKFS